MYKVKVNDHHHLELQQDQEGIKMDGKTLNLDIRVLQGGHLHFIYQQRSYHAEVISENLEEKTFEIKVNGNVYTVAVEDQFDSLLKDLGMKGAAGKSVLELKAPMPGLVLGVHVAVGQEIKKGDNLLVLEAMKMENMLKSTTAGVIKNILVTQGQKVEKNQVLISFA